jgi:hypothetical protein
MSNDSETSQNAVPESGISRSCLPRNDSPDIFEMASKDSVAVMMKGKLSQHIAMIDYCASIIPIKGSIQNLPIYPAQCP